MVKEEKKRPEKKGRVPPAIMGTAVGAMAGLALTGAAATQASHDRLTAEALRQQAGRDFSREIGAAYLEGGFFRMRELEVQAKKFTPAKRAELLRAAERLEKRSIVHGKMALAGYAAPLIGLGIGAAVERRRKKPLGALRRPQHRSR